MKKKNEAAFRQRLDVCEHDVGIESGRITNLSADLRDMEYRLKELISESKCEAGSAKFASWISLLISGVCLGAMLFHLFVKC